MSQIFFVPRNTLYYLHPDVSFFKGGGEPQMGPTIDMPDNTASGDMWNPPDTESTMGISFDGSDAMSGTDVSGGKIFGLYLLR
mmetsp:Transcript_26175/g.53196  ORF Transcript_26175/g.53196 Transcript_26175/m.53196 type:complete len:83 (-) Transcript_26175:144-392(-)